MTRKTISYFSGAKEGRSPAYYEAASETGFWLGGHDVHVKYGGSANGLMGAFCRGFLAGAKQAESGATIEGILPRKYHRVNQPEALGIPFTLTDNLTERKAGLIEGVDAFIVLPGGTGTLDEIYECVEQDYLPADRDPTYNDFGIRPIFVLNLNGYYEHTKAQLEHMIEEGFISRAKLASLQFFDDANQMQAQLKAFLKDEIQPVNPAKA